MPLLCDRGQKGEFMRTGLTKQEKTTDIWFDEKEPLIHIRDAIIKVDTEG